MSYLGPVSTLSPSATTPVVVDVPAKGRTTPVAPLADATHSASAPRFDRRKGDRRRENRTPLVDTREGTDRRRSGRRQIDISV